MKTNKLCPDCQIDVVICVKCGLPRDPIEMIGNICKYCDEITETD